MVNECEIEEALQAAEQDCLVTLVEFCQPGGSLKECDRQDVSLVYKVHLGGRDVKSCCTPLQLMNAVWFYSSYLDPNISTPAAHHPIYGVLGSASVDGFPLQTYIPVFCGSPHCAEDGEELFATSFSVQNVSKSLWQVTVSYSSSPWSGDSFYDTLGNMIVALDDATKPSVAYAVGNVSTANQFRNKVSRLAKFKGFINGNCEPCHLVQAADVSCRSPLAWKDMAIDVLGNGCLTTTDNIELVPQNSAGNVYLPGLEKTEVLPIVNVSVPVAGVNGCSFDDLIGTVNSKAFWLIGAEPMVAFGSSPQMRVCYCRYVEAFTAKLTDIRYQGTKICCDPLKVAEFEFSIKRNQCSNGYCLGWREALPNNGYQELVCPSLCNMDGCAENEVIKDALGDPVQEPSWLNKDGTVVRNCNTASAGCDDCGDNDPVKTQLYTMWLQEDPSDFLDPAFANGALGRNLFATKAAAKLDYIDSDAEIDALCCDVDPCFRPVPTEDNGTFIGELC